MRRRKVVNAGDVPAEIVEPSLWPTCARWDRPTEQPCSCWAAERQHEWLNAGNRWPGGDERELIELFKLFDTHPCRKPFDESII